MVAPPVAGAVLLEGDADPAGDDEGEPVDVEVCARTGAPRHAVRAMATVRRNMFILPSDVVFGLNAGTLMPVARETAAIA
jgi:hypothetical protein